jgi:TPP-dependent pyruvate/acetoin dehydrogenase alpha subunit
MSAENRGAAVDPPELLRRMALIRAFDERALELIWAKRIDGVVHPYIGQEGSAVGVCAALAPGDRVVSNHRGHGHCIAAGADVDRMMAELFGRTTGYCRGRGGSMHIADFEIGMLGANGIVGAGVPMAVGAALADALDGTDRVSVAFFGDGATGQGIVWEALNYAALWKLPVLFVCENNEWAADTPLERTIPVSSVAEIAAGHGLAVETVDAVDVGAVRTAALVACERLRAGAGPLLLETRTHRWKMHASRQVAMTDPRSVDILERGAAADPIAHLREKLLGGGDLDVAAANRIEAAAVERIDAAVEFAESSPLPEPDTALEDVFA